MADTKPPAKPTLSPAELAKLEHAFAIDPSSEAYKALAEAYLGMGRFMEAMVVCKKGVKAHPTAADPRLLLARVYAEQGKDKKALEELVAALQVAPTDKNVLRQTGIYQLKTGENDAGKANLLKAHEVDPEDAETKAALTQWKIEPPKPKAPEPPTERVPVAAPPMAAAAGVPMPGPGVPIAGPGARATGSHRVMQAPPGQPLGNEPVRASGSNPQLGAEPPRPSGSHRTMNGVPAPMRAPGASGSRPALRRDEDEDEDSPHRSRARQEKSKASRNATLIILLLAVLGSTAYYVGGQWRARRNREINKDLQEAAAQLKHDSFESYKKACEAADKALELDPDSVDAHAYLAYAWAIRWGEHGGGDAARKNAQDHYEAAAKAQRDSAYLYSAEALIKSYGGKSQDALHELEERVKAFDEQGKASSLMYLTLGILQMNVGDLERARESLEKAQALSADDPRIYSALGTLYRRRGQDTLSWKNYDFALRYEKGHPDSVIGKALVMLTQDEEKPEYYATAWKLLKNVIDGDPPPSPRQLATANVIRALLISRASADIPRYKPEYQKEISDGANVPIDHAKAQSELVKAEETGFSLDRQNPELFLIKGRRLMFEGNFDGASAEIRKAIEMDPSRAQSYMELARTLLKKPGGEREARDALLQATKTMGESPKLLAMLGDAYAKNHQLDEALNEYQRALKDPKAKNPDARLGLGKVLREKKRYPDAIAALEKAEKEYVGQSMRIAETDTELGRTYEDKGERAKAEEQYKKALNADPDYPDQYFYYARFLSGSDKAKAKATASEYLKLAPKGEHAAEAQKLGQ